MKENRAKNLEETDEFQQDVKYCKMTSKEKYKFFTIIVEVLGKIIKLYY